MTGKINVLKWTAAIALTASVAAFAVPAALAGTSSGSGSHDTDG